ncbi:deoxyribodipyrimidine photolyase [Buchnera aphidicola str. Ua (Uroleucon ambrosiae)]|uniref:Deoxyribodipyrimidine photo-lyase n=1 Tax=Buchnera aphidicola str. Ua (Uroleucon ambrosiae) TaxID=1005057 RepID=G2LPG0_BUCUM|nr:deoxyribodipyrimidine photo-lyase [Buchnera aphidicola]AEO08097.1 deoxyribodipyrimidine photolyase [Buchnera aphidicola str. Ua (Uroleucon ambrosiae)]
MQNNLMWFRNDLRIRDNIALYQACKSNEDQVFSLFIATPDQWNNHGMSVKKKSFIYYNLESLKKELFKLNIVLYYHESTDFLHSVKYLLYFCQKYKINNVFYNYQYEINERKRDCLVKKKLSQKGYVVKGFHDNLLVSHKIIKNNNNQTYKIFSFFKKKIVEHLYKNKLNNLLLPSPRKLKKNIFFTSLPKNNLMINFNTNIFPIGEKEAISRLKNFCTYKTKNYALKKKFSLIDSASMLSPYLSAGIISSRHCLIMLRNIQNQESFKNILNSTWFNQILWREFYYHLLIGFPEISKFQSLTKWEKNIDWIDNIKYLNAWKEGNTGFPIIDASMRQLNQLGWMHNRLRMITASFLVKNLFIDWRQGEKYFMSRLIDGDLALNNGGWQWSASIGCDSVPYIRFFNPLYQSKLFDMSGSFIKQFIPELKHVPNQYIHQPYEWSKKTQSKLDYPEPIINYVISRKKFLLIFNKIKLKYKNKV